MKASTDSKHLITSISLPDLNSSKLIKRSLVLLGFEPGANEEQNQSSFKEIVNMMAGIQAEFYYPEKLTCSEACNPNLKIYESRTLNEGDKVKLNSGTCVPIGVKAILNKSIEFSPKDSKNARLYLNLIPLLDGLLETGTISEKLYKETTLKSSISKKLHKEITLKIEQVEKRNAEILKNDPFKGFEYDGSPVVKFKPQVSEATKKPLQLPENQEIQDLREYLGNTLPKGNRSHISPNSPFVSANNSPKTARNWAQKIKDNPIIQRNF
jgi:hypothetical protein